MTTSSSLNAYDFNNLISGITIACIILGVVLGIIALCYSKYIEIFITASIFQFLGGLGMIYKKFASSEYNSFSRILSVLIILAISCNTALVYKFMNKIKNNHTPPNYNNFSILTECLIFLIYVALSLENTSIIFNKMPINK